MQAVSLNREKIRKKGKKGKKKYKRRRKKGRQKDKTGRKKGRKKDQPSVAKLAKCKLSAQPESLALTKPELKRGKPELKGENRIFREERGGVEQFGRKLKDIKPGALWGLVPDTQAGDKQMPWAATA